MNPTLGQMPTEHLLALELARGNLATANNIEAVAKATHVEAAQWAFQQWSLREKGRAKFARADKMWFVREALEQATHERVAAYHASQFPESVPVVDLTVGIGGDTIALAARGAAAGSDLDEVRLNCAAHNLRVHGLSADLRVMDSLDWPADTPYFWCDPARRVQGRRTLKLDQFSPDVFRVLQQFAHVKLGGLKLSPMLADADLAALGKRIEFISFGSECREAVVWLGAESGDGVHAVHVESGERLHQNPSRREPQNHADEFIFEADPAAVRAHALGTLEEQLDASPLGQSNGYLTGRSLAMSPWVTAFRVLDQGKLDAGWLKTLPYDIEAMKVRGVDIDPAQWVKKVRSRRGELAVALVFPTQDGVKVCVAQRA